MPKKKAKTRRRQKKGSIGRPLRRQLEDFGVENVLPPAVPRGYTTPIRVRIPNYSQRVNMIGGHTFIPPRTLAIGRRNALANAIRFGSALPLTMRQMREIYLDAHDYRGVTGFMRDDEARRRILMRRIRTLEEEAAERAAATAGGGGAAPVAPAAPAGVAPAPAPLRTPVGGVSSGTQTQVGYGYDYPATLANIPPTAEDVVGEALTADGAPPDLAAAAVEPPTELERAEMEEGRKKGGRGRAGDPLSRKRKHRYKKTKERLSIEDSDDEEKPDTYTTEIFEPEGEGYESPDEDEFDELWGGSQYGEPPPLRDDDWWRTQEGREEVADEARQEGQQEFTEAVTGDDWRALVDATRRGADDYGLGYADFGSSIEKSGKLYLDTMGKMLPWNWFDKGGRVSLPNLNFADFGSDRHQLTRTDPFDGLWKEMGIFPKDEGGNKLQDMFDFFDEGGTWKDKAKKYVREGLKKGGKRAYKYVKEKHYEPFKKKHPKSVKNLKGMAATAALGAILAAPHTEWD